MQKLVMIATCHAFVKHKYNYGKIKKMIVCIIFANMQKQRITIQQKHNLSNFLDTTGAIDGDVKMMIRATADRYNLDGTPTGEAAWSRNIF